MHSGPQGKFITESISAFSLMFTGRLTMAVVMLEVYSARVTRESCDLVTKTLASPLVRGLQGMRDGRCGFREVTNWTVCTMDVVRSTVSFLTRWLM